jgi:hypothetical protein
MQTRFIRKSVQTKTLLISRTNLNVVMEIIFYGFYEYNLISMNIFFLF